MESPQGPSHSKADIWGPAKPADLASGFSVLRPLSSPTPRLKIPLLMLVMTQMPLMCLPLHNAFTHNCRALWRVVEACEVLWSLMKACAGLWRVVGS